MKRSLFISYLVKPAPLLTTLALLQPMSTHAHGYIDTPKSRAYMCETQENTMCGAVQYEPQSVEGPKGFPNAGPPDGAIAAGGVEEFAELNSQTPARWKKVQLKTGKNDFSWYFTAGHMTQDWRYYITKAGWDPSRKLTRDSFDLQPFCVIKGGFEPKEHARLIHHCNVPSDHIGYHVILSVWSIADTENAFYQVIDAKIHPGVAANSEEVLISPFSSAGP